MTPWSEAKRRKNILKHGVDLASAEDFEHAAALVEEDLSDAYGEQRFRALGPIGAKLFVYVYSLNADSTEDHAISLRPAEPKEYRFYARNI